jgi:hypothetical protein
MTAPDAKRPKDFELENSRLKKMLAQTGISECSACELI